MGPVLAQAPPPAQASASLGLRLTSPRPPGPLRWAATKRRRRWHRAPQASRAARAPGWPPPHSSWNWHFERQRQCQRRCQRPLRRRLRSEVACSGRQVAYSGRELHQDPWAASGSCGPFRRGAAGPSARIWQRRGSWEANSASSPPSCSRMPPWATLHGHSVPRSRGGAPPAHTRDRDGSDQNYRRGWLRRLPRYRRHPPQIWNQPAALGCRAS
mmetsp:Transcript_59471/g.128615  ORF Transcript_59471/g.128615 Transcript_59471/m.128615 type:complete len:214 (+) Transcript_59471:67-708(+)